MNYMTPILVAVIFALMPIDAALAKDSDCFEKKGKVQLRACLRIIKTNRLQGKRISKKNLANAYNNRGLVYEKKGQFDKAIVDYEKAIQLDPKYAAAYYNRGIAYGKKGQYDGAIADYDKAI